MRNSKLESGFQDSIIKEIKKMFPKALVFKMDQRQGIPDLLVLLGNKWASLECKIDKNAHKQPNQEYYVNLMDNMSFSRFIYPQNKEVVINELYETFKS